MLIAQAKIFLLIFIRILTDTVYYTFFQMPEKWQMSVWHCSSSSSAGLMTGLWSFLALFWTRAAALCFVERSNDVNAAILRWFESVRTAVGAVKWEWRVERREALMCHCMVQRNAECRRVVQSDVKRWAGGVRNTNEQQRSCGNHDVSTTFRTATWIGLLGAESDTEKKKSREIMQSALSASHFIDRNEPHAPRQIDAGKWKGSKAANQWQTVKEV
jgi:hypothetical protein